MPKYQLKRQEFDVEVFEMGTEDGYACYELNGKFLGFFSKHGPIPKVGRIPAILDKDGTYQEVKVGDFVVTSSDGSKQVWQKYIFEEYYELVESE